MIYLCMYVLYHRFTLFPFNYYIIIIYYSFASNRKTRVIHIFDNDVISYYYNYVCAVMFM